MTTNNSITQETLKSLLNYNHETGLFRWLKRRRGARKNLIAGCLWTNKGGKSYIRIVINQKHYLAHRLAWLYITGSFPVDEIDHADGNGTNNKFSNISDVYHSQNSKNVKLRADNKSGITGIHWDKALNKWLAQIRIENKVIYLGIYKTIFAAAYARHAAELEHEFHKNHGTNRSL